MMSINNSYIMYQDDGAEIIIDFNGMSNKQLWEILNMLIKILEKRQNK